MIHEIKDGGTFLLNTSWTERGTGGEACPATSSSTSPDHNVQFYTVDANRLARELGLGNHANMILQAAFFKLSGVMPVEDAVRHMKEAVQKTYAKKGEKVVNMNMAAVDAGINSPVKVNVPADWANAADDRTVDESLPDVVKNIVVPCNRQRGDDLPVSAFLPYQDGTYPLGTSKYDKRGIAALPAPVGQQQVPAVQPVYLCLPPCRHPGLSGGRGGGRCGSRRLHHRSRQGSQGLAVPPAGQHAGLHRLWQLRCFLPCQG